MSDSPPKYNRSWHWWRFEFHIVRYYDHDAMWTHFDLTYASPYRKGLG